MDKENYRYQFVAGNLALDFVNTVAFRADPGKKLDHLQHAEDVLGWAIQAQLADCAAINSSLVGTTALRYIRSIREQLFEVFHAVASDDPIPADTLAHVGNAMHDCCARRCLSIEGGTEVRWTWQSGARCTDYVLYPVLTAATDLLTSGSRGLVRQCEDAGCGWLFLDRSNARTRRWCSMADCGNRNKVRNYYRRETG